MTWGGYHHPLSPSSHVPTGFDPNLDPLFTSEAPSLDRRIG